MIYFLFIDYLRNIANTEISVTYFETLPLLNDALEKFIQWHREITTFRPPVIDFSILTILKQKNFICFRINIIKLLVASLFVNFRFHHNPQINMANTKIETWFKISTAAIAWWITITQTSVETIKVMNWQKDERNVLVQVTHYSVTTHLVRKLGILNMSKKISYKQVATFLEDLLILKMHDIFFGPRKKSCILKSTLWR